MSSLAAIKYSLSPQEVDYSSAGKLVYKGRSLDNFTKEELIALLYLVCRGHDPEYYGDKPALIIQEKDIAAVWPVEAENDAS